MLILSSQRYTNRFCHPQSSETTLFCHRAATKLWIYPCWRLDHCTVYSSSVNVTLSLEIWKFIAIVSSFLTISEHFFIIYTAYLILTSFYRKSPFWMPYFFKLYQSLGFCRKLSNGMLFNTLPTLWMQRFWSQSISLVLVFFSFTSQKEW